MEDQNYGPLAFLIGKWRSEKWTGENRAPDPNREVEETNFRQEMEFIPIGQVINHEQELSVLRYSTLAWEEGTGDDPFHEEVGYFIWDRENKQVLKSFIVPRGISVNAGGTAEENANELVMAAELGSHTYGVCSNKFLDSEFKTIRYDLKITKHSNDSFSYDEDTQLKMKGREEIFHHTEKNTLSRMS